MMLVYTCLLRIYELAASLECRNITMVILCNRCSSSVRQCLCVCEASNSLARRCAFTPLQRGIFSVKTTDFLITAGGRGTPVVPSSALWSPCPTYSKRQTKNKKLYNTDKIWLERFTSGIWAALQVQQILTPQASCIQMFAAHKDFALVFFVVFFAREHKNKVKTIRSRASAGLSSSLSSEVSQAQAHSDIFISSFDWVDRVWTLAWTSIWRTR